MCLHKFIGGPTLQEVSATNVKHDLESLRRDTVFLEETEDNWVKILKSL